MRLTRRAVLTGGAAAVTAAAVPIAMGGIQSFLNRILAEHFGPEVLKIEGVDGFVSDYAAQAGSGNFAKKAAAELYFAWHGEHLKMTPQAQELKSLFLQTFLVRSNIIAITQGRAEHFDYTEVNPWEPTCGLYLSALAEGAV